MSNAVPALEVRNVSKYFGSVIALNDVSLTVMPGEVMCLLGDNGAGKSTLIGHYSNKRDGLFNRLFFVLSATLMF